MLRDLLELGIKEHRADRRDKYEMTGHFKAQLKTFTENFFKENNENYMFRLRYISRHVNFIFLLLIEILKIQLYTYQLTFDATPFEDGASVPTKQAYFNDVNRTPSQKHQTMLNKIYTHMGKDGSTLIQEENLRQGKAMEPDV